MLGAIIGDIVGSPYEFNNINTTDFPLFSDKSRFTDDTVMTMAVAEALMEGEESENYVTSMKKYGTLYLNAGYGGRFRKWLASSDIEPYNSYGNGSAMRVSPVAWWFGTLEDVEKGAEVSAAVTHNHPEGIKGAQAAAAVIFLARKGESKDAIRNYIVSKYGYNLHRTLKKIRPTYKFDGSCQGTVPEAIIAFLESTEFVDAIRKAISLGGDSDTLAAITGSIAEAAYGVPEYTKKQVLTKLDETLLSVFTRWQNVIQDKKYKKVEITLKGAIWRGDIESVRAFIEAGADINAVLRGGWRPLTWAMYCGKTECVRALIDAGADVNTKFEGWVFIEGNGRTPLMDYLSNAEYVRILIDAGADVNAQDYDGMTPLMHAAESGSVKTVRILIEAGADINAIDEHGRTPLMFAAENNRNPDVLRVLIENGASVPIKDKKGKSALDYAGENCNLKGTDAYSLLKI